ncbi:MAG TPA: mechanosensitive ion channel family protein [Longimicrobiales bacterium]|nr:mechanosensitive ion channel family protein [Longimicrobiales bacterium]
MGRLFLQYRTAEAINWPALLSNAAEILLILLLAFGAYRVLRIFTARLQREVEEPDLVRKRLREQRAFTVASLLNNVGLVAIAGIAFLMVLGTFIEIGPLLAGVGVLGLAVSFGAQSLVKDLISGAFMLIEGQFAVGDVVRIKETAGLVEKITLRTLVLRDIHGVVHVIPNGSVETLSNLTKSWSRAVLEIGVGYKEDVDRVMEVMLEEAIKLHQDPDWAPVIVEEPVVPGVERFDDSAVTVRVMFKTLPLKQWDVARQYRRRIKKRFDAEGIEIPFPHRTLYWGAGENPSVPVELGGVRAVEG